ncbi:ketopantoate reductase family protein [Desertibacillus haloalkaliphilus]|uniref:ketopantoate reductase family protein n=1 Tax=Desertibacillus haloalkaliphilus TaxID=1328930 RepID=UPI001C263D26|nr:2-dehydropantoate 2-reductase [Desertibacillus haloalkaliphilus]MBU8906074.1 2-dehydropantoate 2-reductase [Desertibacillus haloalkaliphilus]
MKIAIIGAGAVGGFYGALLSRAGFDVTFVARGKHLEAMNTSGLHVHSSQDQFTINGKFTSDFKELETADLLFFTVKSTETEETAKKLRPFLKEDAGILTLQNGVDNEETLVNILGANRIVSGLTYISAIIDKPGVIYSAHPLQTIIFGAPSKASMHHVPTFANALTEANIDYQISESIIVKKWEKLLWNATFNPLSAASLATVGDILDDRPLRKTAEAVLSEVLTIADRLEIHLQRDWVYQIFSASEIARNHKTSMLQDREKGKVMEVESLCGYFIRKGHELGVRTPTIETIYSILSSINKQTLGSTHQSLSHSTNSS